MSDWHDVKIFQSLGTDGNPRDSRPSVLVIIVALLFILWLFS